MNKVIKHMTPWIVALALFMETLDTTILSTAIPQMAKSFGQNPLNLKLALTSYLLSLAIFIPISGWMADRWGSRNIFVGAMGLFTISSFFCGFSNNLTELIVWRVIQGMGGAMMMPVGRLVLLRTFRKENLIRIMNYITLPALLGPALGPVVGGALTTFFSWRYVFYINVPFGLVGLLLAWFGIVNFKNQVVGTFDWLGFLLFGFGLAGVSFSFEVLEGTVIPMPLNTIILGSSVLFLSTYFIYSRQVKHPLLNFSLFQYRTFSVCALGGMITRMGMGGIVFLLPLLYQLSFKLDPWQAGMLIFPVFVGMMAVKFFVREILEYFGFKKVLVFNSLILGLILMQFYWASPQVPYVLICLISLFYGMSLTLQLNSINTLIYADIDHARMGQATSIVITLQQFFSSVGIGFAVLLLVLFTHSLGISNHINISQFHYVFLVLGIVILFSVFIFSHLKEFDGAQMSGKKIAPPSE